MVRVPLVCQTLFTGVEEKSKWFPAPSVPLHLGLLRGPWCPIIWCPSRGSPVPSIKFQIATWHGILTFSGAKVLPRLQTHTKRKLRFPPLPHTSYIWNCRWAPLSRNFFSECSPVRRPVTNLDCILLTFYSLPVTWCTTSLTFNNCTLCPHCIYVFCIYLRTNSDLCHLQHKLIGFYNRVEKCLQRGTDWVFK